MDLEARAPTLGFNLNLTSKNLIIVLMCGVFAVLFLYDGIYGWPSKNDFLVEKIRTNTSTLDVPALVRDWRGWNSETPEVRKQMDLFAENNKTTLKLDGALLEEWKTSFSIMLQRWIAAGLVLVAAGAIWRFASLRNLVVTANQETVSPRKGLVIPWGKITKVDNTRWHSYGIVEITYTDASGAAKQAEFDDYKTQREPLLKILDLLGEKAVNAEFIPKTDTPPAAPMPRESSATGPGPSAT